MLRSKIKPASTFNSFRSFIKQRSISTEPSTPAINEVVGNNIKVIHNHKWTSFEFLNQNKSFSYNNTFLRDSSTSSNSIDPESGQKLFTTASIIESYPKSIEFPANDRIQITWNDGEISEFDQSFLESNATIENRKFGKYFDEDIVTWDINKELTIYNVPKIDYNDYLTKKESISKVLENLNKYGLSQIINIPTKSDKDHDSSPIVQQIGERIGYIKQTFYGTVFDVRSVPNAKNIAYTSQFLPLHQDLLYYESPPGLQLLHFIKNKSIGGENVFADGFAAARHVKTVDPEAYLALQSVPINYHYDKDGHSYYYSRPLIVENEVVGQGVYGEKDHFKEVNYSPPFQAPFDFGITGQLLNENSSNISVESGAKELGDRHVFQDFLRGLKEFEDYINDPENQLKFKVEENTCIIFDNRRVLHARDQFDNNSGERWLKGCYIDKDAYLSKLRVTKKQIK